MFKTEEIFCKDVRIPFSDGNYENYLGTFADIHFPHLLRLGNFLSNVLMHRDTTGPKTLYCRDTRELPQT